MLPKLGLGILVTCTAIAVSACETPTSAPRAVAATAPSFARGGKPGTQPLSTGISLTPATVQLAVGGEAWLSVTAYDRKGKPIPPSEGLVVWFGCASAAPGGPPCDGYLDMIPIYPNLRDVHLIARAPGSFVVWVDDGAGHTASTSVFIQ